jgi:hypothetical protein
MIEPSVTAGRAAIARLAEQDSEFQFAREVRAGCWDHRRDVSAMIQVAVTWHNANPNTIWNRLAAKLGREPTAAEAKAEVRRILEESRIERAQR